MGVLVRLAYGHGAYFDPLTRLHLTAPDRMQAEISENLDLSNIERAVRAGTLVDPAGYFSRRAAGTAPVPKAEKPVDVPAQVQVIAPPAPAEEAAKEAAAEEATESKKSRKRR